jgi:hypothetical protein
MTPVPTVTPPLMQIVLSAEPEDREGSGLEIVNQTGGAVTAVAVEDSLAYLGIGLRLAIADVSDPENPYVVSWSGILPELVEQISLDDDFIYVALGEAGLWAFDKSDISSKSPIGTIQTTNPARQFLLQDDLAFVANYGGDPATDQVLSVVDVSNPPQPVEISTFSLPVQATKMEIVDGYLYISLSPYYSGYENTLWIIDISDPTQLRMVTAVPELAGRDMAQIEAGELLVLNDKLILVDTSDPTNPKILKESQRMIGYDVLSSINRSGDHVFAINITGDAGYCGGTLFAFDITQIDELQSLSWLQSFSWLNTDCMVYEVVVSNNSLYMATDHGLSIVDIRDPAKLSYTGNLQTIPPLAQIDIGEFLFGAEPEGNVFAFNIENHEQPSLKGKNITNYWVNDLLANGTKVYIATQWDKIIMVDFTGLDDPQELIATEPKYPIEDSDNLVLDEGYIYGSLVGNLGVFDAITLAWLGEDNAEPFGEYNSFTVDKKVLWTWKQIDGVWGLLAENISEPQNTKQIGFLPHENSELFVDQDFIYTIPGQCRLYRDLCEESVLNIIDVSNPAKMELLSTLSVPGSIRGMSKSDDMLILFGDYVRVIDVSEPTQPQIITQLEIPGYVTDIAVKDNLIYVANGARGMLVLRMDESLQP